MFRYNVVAKLNGEVLRSENGLLDYGSAAILAEIIWPREGARTLSGNVMPDTIHVYEYTKNTEPELIREYAV